MKKTLLLLFSTFANKLLKNYPNRIFLFFTLFLSVLFFSCENEPLSASEPSTEVKADLPYTTKSMSLKDVPEVESYLRSILSNKTNKSATSKSINDLEPGASFDIEKIVETTDSTNNKNYSIRFVFDDTPENVFYNLVVNFLPSGEKHAFVEKYTCTMENYLIYRNSRYNFNYFKGKVDLYYYTAFFGKKATAVLAKTTTSATPCQQAFYPNGDPIPTLSSFVGSGGTDTGSGGSTNTTNPNSNNGNASWPATGGYGLSVFTTGNNQSSSDSDCCSCGDCGIHWYLPSKKNEHTTQKTSNDPCATIIPIGFIGIQAEPENLAILRSQIPLTLEQWQWLHGKDALMGTLLQYINTKPSSVKIENVLTIIKAIVNGESFETYKEMIQASLDGGDVDFVYQVIVDKSLKDNPCLFGVYTKLGKAPTFQSYLQKFDSKFSVANLKLSVGIDPSNPQASATTFEPVNKLIEIRFNPTKLNTPQLNIARTFIHEMIHAEIYRQLLSVAGRTNIPWSAAFIKSIKDDFKDLSDYYTRFVYNVPAGQQPTSAQHELMADHYRNVIIQAMKEFDPTQSNETYIALSWIGLMGSGIVDETVTGLPPKPTVAWKNTTQSERLIILKIFDNFKKTNVPCQ